MTPDRREKQSSRRNFLATLFHGLRQVHALPGAMQIVKAEEAAWDRMLGTTMTRQRFIRVAGAGIGALGVMSPGLLWEHLHAATVTAQGGRWIIQDIIDYERGMGRQSFSWLPAREGYGPAPEFDQAERNYRGWAPPIPVAEYLEQQVKALMNSVPNGSFWVGDCQSASIASGDCPYIEGDKEAFGVVMPWWERMQLAVWHNRYTKLVEEWIGPLTLGQYNEIRDRYEQMRVNNQRLVVIANTSDYRGYRGQEWWGYVDGFAGDNVVIVDFLEWKDLQDGKPKRKEFGPVPYNRITSIKLVDPNQSEDGHEDGFNFAVYRPVAKVFLDKATAIPR